MINELKVFYTGEKGIMTFANKKTIFQHREHRENVKIGLGVVSDTEYYDKGTYAFAVFKNVPTVIPDNYYKVEFFNNKGVPIKIEKGKYGDNILVRETYKDRTYIRAYKEDGTIGLYESKTIKNAEYEGPNVYYNRLEEVITDWEDITESVLTKVFASVAELKADLDLSSEGVLAALKGLTRNKIYRLENGVIIADGKFESLVIWGTSDKVEMCWLGNKYDLTQIKHEDITEDLISAVKACNDKD